MLEPVLLHVGVTAVLLGEGWLGVPRPRGTCSLWKHSLWPFPGGEHEAGVTQARSAPQMPGQRGVVLGAVPRGKGVLGSASALPVSFHPEQGRPGHWAGPAGAGGQVREHGLPAWTPRGPHTFTNPELVLAASLAHPQTAGEAGGPRGAGRGHT